MSRPLAACLVLGCVLAAGAGSSCSKDGDDDVAPYVFNTEVFPSRYPSIPGDQANGFALDAFPVEVVDTVNWDPATLERLPAPVSSEGIEDAPFISPDGSTLYLTFIGDIDHVITDPMGMLNDPAAGIYRTQFDGAAWSEPERIGLVRNGEQALVGGGSIKNDGTFWFNLASAGTGWSVHTYVAYMWGGRLSIGYDPGAPINLPGVSAGEPDISSDGTRLYINSSELGGEGGNDLFVFDKVGGVWQGPVNLGPNVNTANEQNRPFITPDGQHLYFDSFEGATGTGISIFRSDWTGAEWGAPVEIIRNNLGEPSLTADGEWLYFVHYYYDAGLNAIEADIFRVRRK
ncbi:MAG: TolB family protein [Planctomycetota bacterium]